MNFIQLFFESITVSEGGSSEPNEPPLDPPLTILQTVDLADGRVFGRIVAAGLYWRAVS